MAALAACAVVLAAAGPTGAQDGTDQPPAVYHRAVTMLPPGQSGFVNAEGQARGTATGDPDDYGEHIDDQRERFWNLRYKDGDFHANGDAEEPRPGVRIYRDAYGVPAVYAGTTRDIWFGVGYAIAQDRLFLMDAVRRTGRGTLAELVGASSVPADIQQRVLTYSDAEYMAMFEQLSAEAKAAIRGYVDGANAWREEAITNPDLLPAEYGLLTSVPEEFTIIDVLAGGVYITRFVASEGGNEFQNVRALRRLEAKFGKRKGRRIFRDFVWQDDPKAAVTVPGQSFANQSGSARRRRRAFQAMADYAATLPLSLEKGLGTGHAPVPDPAAPAAAPAPPQPAVAADAVEALNEWRASLRGGSYAFAVGPSRTATGEAMLVSGPQLGYTYPSLLAELEIHGAGYHARGVSVPGLPTVGIGYNQRVAWALTTGYSKTIDSFIETTRGSGDARRYRHKGQWKRQRCRTETVRYRASVSGAPVGPAAFSESFDVCRTVHGPIVAQTADGTRARSVQYAMFGKELQTIEGILAWNKADNLEEFRAGVRKVTWNENVAYADKNGHIAYWHPGIYPQRDPDGDQRLPLPGRGAYDHDGRLPFRRMPHSIDPPQGFLANWNNKPARGWADGEGISPTSRPAGAGARLTALRDQLRRADDLTFAGLRATEQRGGLIDPRAREYKPLLDDLRRSGIVTGRQRRALRLIAAWNGRHFGPGAGTNAAGTTDGPAPTIFDEIVLAIRDELFGSVPPLLLERQIGVGSHVYDVSAADNLALRVLDPRHSGLGPSRDYTGDRSPRRVLKAALRTALNRLERRYDSAALRDYRRSHPVRDICSLTGVIGPCLTMPYHDRGSWVHAVAFGPRRSLAATTARTGDSAGDAPVLPATGASTLAALGAAVIGAGLLLRRQR